MADEFRNKLRSIFFDIGDKNSNNDINTIIKSQEKIKIAIMKDLI